MAQVDIVGDPGTLEKRIRAIARRISGDRPLRQATFERYAPDSASCACSPAASPVDRLGTVALGLRLSDGKRYNVDLAAAQPTADLPLESDRREPRLNLTFAYDFR